VAKRFAWNFFRVRINSIVSGKRRTAKIVLKLKELKSLFTQIMTDQELKQLIESNARTAQAMLDSMVEARLEREELREGIQELRSGFTRLEDIVARLTTVQEGMTNLLASLDNDRPTILKKLNTIENKVDRLLEKSEDSNL
jgi:chromosome segregation ATPase